MFWANKTEARRLFEAGLLEKSAEALRASAGWRGRDDETARLVIEALAGRARCYLRNNDFEQAVRDCDVALAVGNMDRGDLFGGYENEVLSLRQTAWAAQQACEKRKAQAKAKVLEAGRYLKEGQLTLAGKMAQKAQEKFQQIGLMHSSQRGVIRNVMSQAARQREVAAELCAKAQEVLASKLFAQAVRYWHEAKTADAGGIEVQQTSDALREAMSAEFVDALRQGRLDEAAQLGGWLGGLGGGGLRGGGGMGDEARQVMEEIKSVAGCVKGGKWTDAIVLLERAGQGCEQMGIGRPEWMKELLAEVRTAEACDVRLRAGPLGRWMDEAKGKDVSGMWAGQSGFGSRSVYGRTGLTGANALENGKPLAGGRPFVLHVDGADSYRVVEGMTLTVGPIGSGAMVQIAGEIASDGKVGAILLRRSEEATILESARSVFVDGKETTRAVLKDGQRVSLSPRCWFVYRRASAASETAILELAHVKPGGLKKVIWMDGEILIGAGPACHIRTSNGGSAVLYRNDQTVCVRGVGMGIHPETALLSGQTADLDGIRLVATLE